MNRKKYDLAMLLLAAMMLSVCLNYTFAAVDDILPTGKSQPALEISHFPAEFTPLSGVTGNQSRLNGWPKSLVQRRKSFCQIAQSMGLPPHAKLRSDFRQRAYYSIIRRNWHLLPYDQLLTLLDWDAEKLAFTLREDDFLWIKLGNMKPSCPPLRYTDPDEATKKRCEEIKRIVSSYFAEELAKPFQPRFDFIETLCAVDRAKNP